MDSVANLDKLIYAVNLGSLATQAVQRPWPTAMGNLSLSAAAQLATGMSRPVRFSAKRMSQEG
ncbi:hypothetical protein D3C75_1155720 [compost metagenome]